METLITYGSQYGSAEYYAKKFAECKGVTVLPYREVKSTGSYDRVIHFGALYAGGFLQHLQTALIRSNVPMENEGDFL